MEQQPPPRLKLRHIDSFTESRYLLVELEQKVEAMRAVAFHIAAAVEREEDIPAR